MFELGEIRDNIRIFYLKGNRFNSHNVSIPKNTPEDSIAPRSIVTHSLISYHIYPFRLYLYYNDLLLKEN